MLDTCMNGWMDKQRVDMNEWMDGQINWIDERMNEQTNEWMDE